MVESKINKEARLVSEAAKELLDHVEKLLQDVIIELPEQHTPIRRAVTLWDPVGSNFGQELSFALFKKALEQMESGEEQLLGIEFQVGDEENAGFAQGVKKLVDDGMSQTDAIGAMSGGFNLDTLAEGLIPGFIKMIQSMLPSIPVPSGLGEQAGPISGFMSAGLPENALTGPSLAYAVKDAAKRVKDIAKSSVGIRATFNKEVETAPAKVVKYAIATAVQKTSEYSPARIWHAWSLYPEIRAIYLDSLQLINSNVDGKSGVSYRQNDRELNVETVMMEKLANYREQLRGAATILSSCLPVTNICCIVSLLTKHRNAQALIDRARAAFDIGAKINQLDFNLQAPNYTNYFETMKAKALSKMITSFDERFVEMVKSLRDIHETIVGKLPPEIAVCVPLDTLFDYLLSVLRTVRNRVVGMLQKEAARIQLQNREAKSIQKTVGANLRFTQYQWVLNLIEHEVSFAERCQLSDNVRRGRALNIIQGLCDGGLPVHRRGQPIPNGADPGSVLLNLDPLVLDAITLEPGIQDTEVPTGELEQLFDACRSSDLSQFDSSQLVKAMFRRP